MRVKKVLLSGATTALLAGAAVLGFATPALAVSCDQLQQRYDDLIEQAQWEHSSGVYFRDQGNFRMADFYFGEERSTWIDIDNVQLC